MKKEDKRHLIFLVTQEMVYAAFKYLALMNAVFYVIERNIPYTIIIAIMASQMGMNEKRAYDDLKEFREEIKLKSREEKQQADANKGAI